MWCSPETQSCSQKSWQHALRRNLVDGHINETSSCQACGTETSVRPIKTMRASRVGIAHRDIASEGRQVSEGSDHGHQKGLEKGHVSGMKTGDACVCGSRMLTLRVSSLVRPGSCSSAPSLWRRPAQMWEGLKPPSQPSMRSAGGW